MSDRLKISFATPAVPASGTMVVFVGDDLALSPIARELLGSGVADAVARAAAAEAFKGKALSGLTLLAPAGLQADRLVVIGLGSAKDRSDTNYLNLGGAIIGRAGSSKAIAIILDGPAEWRADADAAADIGLGLSLRSYSFDKYKSKKPDSDKPAGTIEVTIGTDDPAGARRAMKSRTGVAEGVTIARNLVNEPPNVLFPAEFARRAEALEKLGVEVEVLDEKKLEKIGMRALLGVGRARGARARSSSCAGMARNLRKPSLSRSSARAFASIPEVSPSSPLRAWRT